MKSEFSFLSDPDARTKERESGHAEIVPVEGRSKEQARARKKRIANRARDRRMQMEYCVDWLVYEVEGKVAEAAMSNRLLELP